LLTSCGRLTTTVAVWRSDNGVGSISEVTLRWARLVLRWVTVFGRAPTRCLTSHWSQLSRLPLADGKRVPAKKL